jgi:anthrone oxygenase-like protein
MPVSILAVVRMVAILCSGLFTGILFGDRMGATFARPLLSPSSFLQFQRIQHVHFERMMPPLLLVAIASGLGWLIIIRGQWHSPQFWTLFVAVAAMVVAAVLTVRVNLPINKQLMTWDVGAPPDNMREIWSRWEKAHTIRTVLWLVAFASEAVVLSMSVA